MFGCELGVAMAEHKNRQQNHKPHQACAKKSRAHVQCDSIIMDKAKIRSIPEITANDASAQIVHEAAIGRINNDQLLKLMKNRKIL